MKKITIAVIGCGAFAHHFIALFKAHPLTEKVYVCDLEAKKAAAFAAEFGVEAIESFEKALESKEIDCIANYTRRHQHGEISIRALKAGKHVFSAVPMASSVEECMEIVRLTKETGLTYMIGETCYYYPCAMFCREMYKTGRFGTFAYGASQYYHHIDSISYGKVREERGMPPLFYPTHSTAMLLSAVGDYVKKVVCFGCKTDDAAFQKGANPWENEYINHYTLMHLSGGGTARVTEARGFGYGSPSSYISAFYGTRGSYEFSNAQHLFYEMTQEDGQEKIRLTDVSDYVNPADMVSHKLCADFKERVANGEWQRHSPAAVQEAEYARLPQEYAGLPNGHMASHQLLTDDFCKAAASGETPRLNAWFAARCNIPGLVAIESAKQGGIPLAVPDCGEAPTK